MSTTLSKRYFDMDANGVAERVSWAASGDASLAMDRDGDGRFEDHELATLDEASIESIGLSYTEQRTDDENGNQIVRLLAIRNGWFIKGYRYDIFGSL